MGAPVFQSTPSFHSNGGFGNNTDAMLLQWHAARDKKDWTTADSIRATLRAQGIEPADRPKPSPVGSGWQGKAVKSEPVRSTQRASPYGGGSKSGKFSVDIEAMLDEWLMHKSVKNFEAADAIRSKLRAKGVEPDQHRCERLLFS